MFIDAGFDGGNIEFVSADDEGQISLKIRNDSNAEYAQWFYFRVLGALDQHCSFNIMNAGDASYPEAWPDGSVVASHDGNDWFRISTKFDGTRLTFEHACPSNILFVALSPPYPLQRHHDLICRALASDMCELAAHISSVEKRGIEVLRIGLHNEDAPKGRCCTDQLQLGTRLARDGFQAVRSKLGRPSPVIRLRTRTAILASVF